MPDLTHLQEATFAAVADSRGVLDGVRGMPRPLRLLLLLALMFAEGLFFFFIMKRRDFDTYPSLRMALTLGGYGALSLALLWHAMRPLYRPPAPAVHFGLVGLGLLAPIVVALIPGVPGFEGAATFKVAKNAYYCIVVGAGVALALMLAARLADRTAHALSSAAVAATTAGGLMAALALQIECGWNYWLHLLTGHATVPFILLGGWWLFRRAARA